MLEPFLNVLSDSKQLQLTVREQQWHQVNGWLYKQRVEWDWSVGSGLCPHLTTPGSSGTLGLFIQLVTTEKKSTCIHSLLCVWDLQSDENLCVCVFNEYIWMCFVCVRHRWVFVEGSVQWGGCFDHWECGTVETEGLGDGISEEGVEQDLSSMSKQAHK